MKIIYDEQVGAMYTRLIEGNVECCDVVLTDEITLDFGSAEQLVCIEIPDAIRAVGQGKLPQIVVDDLRVAAA